MSTPSEVSVATLGAAALHCGWNAVLCGRRGELGTCLVGGCFSLIPFIPYMIYIMIVELNDINLAGPYFFGSGVLKALSLLFITRAYKSGELSLTLSVQCIVLMLWTLILWVTRHGSIEAIHIATYVIALLGASMIAGSLGVIAQHVADDDIANGFEPMHSDVVSFDENPFKTVKKKWLRKRGKEDPDELVPATSCIAQRWTIVKWASISSLAFAGSIELDTQGVQLLRPIAFSVACCAVMLAMMMCLASWTRPDELALAWQRQKLSVVAVGFMIITAPILFDLGIESEQSIMGKDSLTISVPLFSVTSAMGTAVGILYEGEPYDKLKVGGLGLVCIAGLMGATH